MKILHENGAEIDARDHSGQTPLHVAVAAGQTDSAKLLLSFGAKVTTQDKRLRCCLHIAVEQNREETVSMLLSEAAAELVNIPDHKQRTPLHYGACSANPKVNDPPAAAVCIDSTTNNRSANKSQAHTALH